MLVGQGTDLASVQEYNEKYGPSLEKNAQKDTYLHPHACAYTHTCPHIHTHISF